MGFAESIYTTVVISFDGYSTDLLKGKRPTRVNSECNAPSTCYSQCTCTCPLTSRSRARLCVAVERLSARA